MKVTFFPSLKSIEVESGITVIEAAESAGVLIDASCNGMGTCGKCKVKIDGKEVLACQTVIDRDMDIYIPATHGGSDRKKKMVKLPEDFCFDSTIHRNYIKVPKAKMDYQLNDIDRTREAVNMPDLVVPEGVIQKLHNALDANRGNVTITTRENVLIDIVPEDCSTKLYGIAYDIGTTTVVGMLWNLKDGTLIDVDTRTNYQSIYGADVISRISHTIQNEDGLEQLQSKVITCLNDITEGICKSNDINPLDIMDATIVGNTTMSHLIWGVNPKSLSRTPFAPVFSEARNMAAEMLGININPKANIHLLPNIAGHVGSDITAMILSSGIHRMKGSHIAIDIGTNGEIVAIKDGRLLCCSTAAGPAFEGATIEYGMRAASGAIEKVVIDNTVTVSTIDNAKAIGICGSGLIDAVSELLKCGLVDDSGRMLSKEQTVEIGINDNIASHIVAGENGSAFVLADESASKNGSILLTQNDIREVQLAKGAILAGIQTLMKELEMTIDDIDSIMLAGAFGNYINICSALKIGLLPQVDESKVIAIGNAAGNGSSMALLSAKSKKIADELVCNIEHIELSCNEDFQDYYISAMKF